MNSPIINDRIFRALPIYNLHVVLYIQLASGSCAEQEPKRVSQTQVSLG